MIGRRDLLRTACGLFAAGVGAAAGGTRRAGLDAPDTVAVVYDVGGKTDKGFNQSAFRGVLALRRRGRGPRLTEHEVDTPAARGPVLRQVAREAPAVIVVGGAAAATVARVARDHPDRRFVLIDGTVAAPNVASIVFADHEAAFLAGVMAGMATETGRAGFVGGAPLPPVARFRTGFRQGLARTRPDARVLEAMLTAETEAPWNDPFAGLLAGRALIARGADVLFAAAGASGLGVHQAAADAGALSIGVDSNQNFLYPGTVLTSAVKRVDAAVEHAVALLVRGPWPTAPLELGLAEGAVGVAFDKHNARIAETMRPVVAAYREKVISGAITVDPVPDPAAAE